MNKIDLHMHTIASFDAQSTIYEYVQKAKKLGIDIIGISDHGPSANVFISNIEHFRIIVDKIPRVCDGIRVLKGSEVNIINIKGEIDLPDKIIKKLDYVMAGLHTGTKYPGGSSEENTTAIINAIKSGKVHAITHPFGTLNHEINIEKVSEAACKNNVLLEVNLSYLRQERRKEDAINNLKKMLVIVKKYNQKIIVGSDSHNAWELEINRELKKYQKEFDIPDDMIINNNKQELFDFLGIKE